MEVTPPSGIGKELHAWDAGDTFGDSHVQNRFQTSFSSAFSGLAHNTAPGTLTARPYEWGQGFFHGRAPPAGANGVCQQCAAGVPHRPGRAVVLRAAVRGPAGPLPGVLRHGAGGDCGEGQARAVVFCLLPQGMYHGAPTWCFVGGKNTLGSGKV